MSLKEFIAWLQGYYGQIPPGQRADVIEYLSALAPSYLAALKEAVKRRFSSQYGKTPDVAVFEECKPDALAGQSAILDSRAAALLEAPPERGEGDLMAIDWPAIFNRMISLHPNGGPAAIEALNREKDTRVKGGSWAT